MDIELIILSMFFIILISIQLTLNKILDETSQIKLLLANILKSREEKEK